MPASIPGRIPPKRRTFEIPSDVHDAAKAKAYATEGRYLTEVIIDVLNAYVRRSAHPADPVVAKRTPGGRTLHKVSVRIPDAVWTPALDKAGEYGDALAEVIARGLADYASKP